MGARRGTTPHSTAARPEGRIGGSGGGAGGVGAASAAVANESTQLKQTIEGLERERDFFLSKLRDMELLIQQAPTPSPLGAQPRLLLVHSSRWAQRKSAQDKETISKSTVTPKHIQEGRCHRKHSLCSAQYPISQSDSRLSPNKSLVPSMSKSKVKATKKSRFRLGRPKVPVYHTRTALTIQPAYEGPTPLRPSHFIFKASPAFIGKSVIYG